LKGGANAEETLAYCMQPSKEKRHGLPERIPAGNDRLLNDKQELGLYGDLCGYGHAIRDAKLMSEALICGTELLKGKQARHLVISGDDTLPEKDRSVWYEKAKQAVPLLMREMGVSRWVVCEHHDTFHPHVHVVILIATKDLQKRLNIAPKFLSELQNFEWCKDQFGEQIFEPGKGSRKRQDRIIRVVAEGKQIDHLDKPMEAAVKGRKKRLPALQKLAEMAKKLWIKKPFSRVEKTPSAAQLGLLFQEVSDPEISLRRRKNGTVISASVEGETVRMQALSSYMHEPEKVITKPPPN
ncbi:MAG: relaxase/mobilization nuclease domain-containing protein, partial [Chthoniobacterales bacterium]